MEAIPQVHIIIILFGLLEDEFDLVAITSLVSSILSSTYGIAKLLKNGPIKLIKKDGGKGGFVLILALVLGNMAGKVGWTSVASSPRSAQKTDVIWIWTLTCLLPQILLTLLVWFTNLGLKTFKFICLYPSYFLLSIFSPFMVSGDSDSGFKTVAISKIWTLVNFCLSVIGTIIGIYVYDLYSNGGLADVGYFSFVLKSVAIFLGTFVFAAIFLAIFYCCSCCTCSMERTGIDVNDFGKIIDLQTGQQYGIDGEPNTHQRNGTNDQIEPIPSPSEADQECDNANDEAIEAKVPNPLEDVELNIINESVVYTDNPDAILSNSNTDQLEPTPCATDQEFVDEEVKDQDGDNDQECTNANDEAEVKRMLN